jgi:hypothetical protein
LDWDIFLFNIKKRYLKKDIKKRYKKERYKKENPALV